MEAEPIGGGEVEAEHGPQGPPSPSCDPGCSCVCHQRWPGMKLVWVPVDAEDGVDAAEEEAEEEEDVEEKEDGEDGEEVEETEEREESDLDEDAERGGEGDSEAGEEVDRIAEVAGSEEQKQNKSKFHQTLGVLIAEAHRRRSDPGPPAVMALAITRSQSPPVPPKHGQAAQIPSEYEEENVYELTLPVVPPHAPKQPPKEMDIPLIKVRKPARRSKLSYSTSDPTSEFQQEAEPAPSPGEVPPAIPPRMPVAQDGRSLTPAPRGGIALPQPIPEERRALRSSSPSSSSISSGLSPQRAITPPPASPLRPPPPPPKTDPRRLSTASLQALTPRKGWIEEIWFNSV